VSCTVLIVDDEPDTLATLQEAFEYDGYSVLAATDGAVALAHLRSAPQPPCAAILDVMMPTMDGNALYSTIKSDPRFTKVSVIFCTSAPSLAPAGVTAMKKPIELGRLLSLVRQHCPR
jgi:two-component system, chemotaxis family, chemotaxis protein CheY